MQFHHALSPPATGPRAFVRLCLCSLSDPCIDLTLHAINNRLDPALSSNVRCPNAAEHASVESGWGFQILSLSIIAGCAHMYASEISITW